MEIREIKNKQEWEDFLAKRQEKTFLQSWGWGEFQKSMDEKIWRFGVYEQGNLISIALVIKVVAKRGSFFLVPHGPAVTEGEKLHMEQVLSLLVTQLRDLAKQERVDFI